MSNISTYLKPPICEALESVCFLFKSHLLLLHISDRHLDD